MGDWCPKCNRNELEMPLSDGEMVCQNCGTAFRLGETGWYEDGGNTLQVIDNPYFAKAVDSAPGGEND